MGATILFFLPLFVFAYYNPGQPTGFVNDFSGTLNAQQIKDLNDKLINFEKETSNEISVVLIPSLKGDTVENFAEKLFQEWKIGKDKKDNGALLLIAVEDRKMRIEVGYGLEGALTDAQSFIILQKDLVPAFKAKDFYGGINSALDDIIAATKGEYAQEVKSIVKNLKFSVDWLLFVFFGLIWLVSILGKSKSWWLGGVVGALIGLFFWSIIWIVIFGLFGLLIDYLASRSYKKSMSSGGTPPWWFGGGWGGSGGSGGGFGGFGGGSSGGGGSSSSW